MKPWEGKHFKQIIENYSGCEPNLCMFNAGIHNAILNLTEALKKDWEDQQKETPCAQTAEKEKSDHQGLSDNEKTEFLQELVNLTQQNIYFMNGGEISRSFLSDKYEKELIKVRDFINEQIFEPFHDEKKAESFTSLNCKLHQMPEPKEDYFTGINRRNHEI